MTKIGIIICARYQNCGGGKCFRALRERTGAFSRYSKDEKVEIVGYSTCGGCPGGNVEDVPEEMIENGAEVIHLATGMVVGYPQCPYLKNFKDFIEKYYKIPVVIGTHPIPYKYFITHNALDMWEKAGIKSLAAELIEEDEKIMKAYD